MNPNDYKPSTVESVTDRERILQQAIQCICHDRQNAYGEPEDSFECIAALWEAYMGIGFSAKDVAIMMALLKVARIATGKHKADNYIDLAGYAACAGELAERENEGVPQTL